ncbi:MAG: hypothetical protein RBR40_14370, partial [Tenuifilaceae bacterium]|nr:hypothetical protein [Tenuifilaceae bacterium]
QPSEQLQTRESASLFTKDDKSRPLRWLHRPTIFQAPTSRWGKGKIPSSKSVSGYLKNCPGQRASLTGFINFLHKEYNLEINIPVKSSFAATRNRKLEKQLVALVKKEWGKTEYLYWCKYSLELFHGLRLPVKIVKELILNTKKTDGGINLIRGKVIYFLPK